MAKLAYIGMGANLGNPIEQLVSAKRLLSNLAGVAGLRSSAYYLSSPVGYDDQPDFLNCVVELTTTMTVQALFSNMQQIEGHLGRQRDPKNQNAARLIDLDLLWFDGITIQEVDLVVPHPRMHQRLFVLEPLAELNAGLAVQVKTNTTPSDFANQDIVRLAL